MNRIEEIGRVTQTAEEVLKIDISIRWSELVNAIAYYEKNFITLENVSELAQPNFIKRFFAFYHATEFYVEEKVQKKTQQVLDDLMQHKKISPLDLIKTAREYCKACFKAGLFLKSEGSTEL